MLKKYLETVSYRSSRVLGDSAVQASIQYFEDDTNAAPLLEQAISQLEDISEVVGIQLVELTDL